MIPGITTFKVPPRSLGWIAYMLKEAPSDTTQADSLEKTVKKESKSSRKAGKPLVLRELFSGEERVYQNVTTYELSEDGRWLAFATATTDSSGDGLFVVFTGTGEKLTAFTNAGDYKQISFDEAGRHLAFLSNHRSIKSERPYFELFHWNLEEKRPENLEENILKGISEDWSVSEHQKPYFSKKGDRLFFGTNIKPQKEAPDTLLEEEKINVDVWHWQDNRLMPQQQKELAKDRKRSYLSVVLLKKGNRVIQLADPQMPFVLMNPDRDGDFAVGYSNLPYQKQKSWDFPARYDFYRLDLNRPGKSRIATNIQARPNISPGGKYLYWWDGQASNWIGCNLKNPQKTIVLTTGIDRPLYNEQHDWPFIPNGYGVAGWLKEDRAMVVYDRFDLWRVDPDGKKAPVNLTGPYGREKNLRFRYNQLDKDVQFMPDDKSWLLSTTNLETFEAGFSLFDPKTAQLNQPDLSDHRFSRPEKAENAKVIMYTRESYSEFPDLWAASLSLDNPKQISNVNPQQSEYAWGTVEQMRWYSVDGEMLKGNVYRPQDFDITQKHPMIVYFYEKNSHNLNRYYAPGPHRSVISPSFYASRGYVVFVPDIPYKIGFPGESAMNAVMPGVTKLIDEGAIDPERIGVQGHSWGGYQIAYMVTRTNLFAAAAAGAPVSNMISAYGGIRWGTGLSRMFQYEKTQSRIGGSLWEKSLYYLENSPIFWVEKIETPLLMMHNDEDGAVPWYQGIEMFVAMRRLEKPAWLINYSGEPHWPQPFLKKRDWQIRLQEYFDHYLMGAPSPKWLSEGVPALSK